MTTTAPGNPRPEVANGGCVDRMGLYSIARGGGGGRVVVGGGGGGASGDPDEARESLPPSLRYFIVTCLVTSPSRVWLLHRHVSCPVTSSSVIRLLHRHVSGCSVVSCPVTSVSRVRLLHRHLPVVTWMPRVLLMMS